LLVGLAILLSVIVIPFGVFGSEEDTSGGNEDNDNVDTNENGGNGDNDDNVEPEEKIDPELPDDPPIEGPVQLVDPELCPPDQDECLPEPELPIDPCLENPNLDECQPGQPCDPTIDVNCVPESDPCLMNPDLDECQSHCIENLNCMPPPPCDPTKPHCPKPPCDPKKYQCPPKCGKGTHLEKGICVRDKGNGDSSSSSTTITINAAEVYSCRIDGSSDGIQQEFNSIKYQACGLYPNGHLAYSDGFITGCTQAGNTQVICQALVDSSILNTKIQPTQTAHAIQPTPPAPDGL
jgi:hypothetical protein